MNLKNLFRKVGLLLFLVVFSSGSLLAQVYVSKTNGDDLNNNGTSFSDAYATITEGLANAADGDTLYIHAGTYDEEGGIGTPAPIAITKAVILQAVQLNADTEVIIPEGFEIDAAGKTAEIATGAASLDFILQDGGGNSALVLTDGTLNIDGDKVTIDDGSTIERADGSVNEAPTSTNLNVTYVGMTDDVVAGPELSADLGTGDLTVNDGGGTFVVEFPNAFATNDFIVTDGTADLQADVSADGDLTLTAATSVIQLNSNTLTWGSTSAGRTMVNNGEILSDASATVGDGVLMLTGDEALNLQGDLPNVNIPAGFENTATVDGAANLYGTLTVGSAEVPALLTNADVTVFGDFLRTDDTDGNVDFLTNNNELIFDGGSNVFDPGETLTIHGLQVNLDAAANVLTMQESIRLEGDLDINAGVLAIGSYNVRLLGGANQTVTNTGGYTTNNDGFLIVQNGQGANVIQGAATFGNLDIRAAGTVVDLGSAIDFSGILNVREAELGLGGNDLTFTDDLTTVPVVNYYTTAAQISTTGGTFAVDTDVEYDINYYGDFTVAGNASATELLAAGIRNLTQKTSAAGGPDLVLPQATEITGALYVESGEGFDLNNFDLTLSGPGETHTVLGTVYDAAGPGATSLIFQGDGSLLTGSTDDADERSVENVEVDIAAGETFDVTNIENILGNLTVNDGTVGVSLIDDPTNNNDGQLDGDVTVVDGTLTLAIADESDGDDASQENIEGDLLINDGTLVLGSSILVDGTTDLGAGAAETGSVNLSTFDLIAGDQFTHNGTGTITGTGALVLDYTVGATSQNFVLTTPLSVSNLEINDGTGGTTITQTTDDLTVTNSLVFIDGTYDFNGLDITLKGNTLENDPGTATATVGPGNLILNGTDMQVLLSDDFTVNPDVELDATSLLLVDNDGDANPGEFQLIIAGDFTQTTGDVDVDDNDLVLQGDFTRVAGGWMASTTAGDLGYLVLDGGNTIVPGTGFSVENLWIMGGATVFPDDEPWRIENRLVLGDNTLDPGNDGTAAANPQLTFADMATIERQDDAAQLLDDADYDGSINLEYTTDAGGIVTSDEASATTINDVLVEVPVDLDRDFGPINGMLTLEDFLDDEPGATDYDVLMANGSWVKLVDDIGTNLVNNPLDPQGTLNVYYDNGSGGPLATTDNELDNTFTIGAVTVDGATALDDITLHDTQTFTGLLTINDDGDLDMNGLGLTLEGGFTRTAAGTIINGGATAALTFSGTSSDLTLGTVWSVPASINFHLDMTNDEDVLTLKGANLDLATGPSWLWLDKGAFQTDDDVAVVLFHGTAGATIQQGFTRTAGVITGNAQKNVDVSNTAAITNITFPVGADPASPANYRPATFFFPNAPGADFDLTVNHEDANPGGTNGIAPNGLDGGGVTITNYPSFYWYVKSSTTLNPSLKFDFALEAEGYDYYNYDEIEDIRMIRRDSGQVNNEWRLQGSGTNYDNATINPGDIPVVKVIDAQGGITFTGSRFTYSQSNVPPMITRDVASPVNITETDSLVVNYTATDPDISQSATLALVSAPAGATYDAGKLTWKTTFADSGSYSVIMSATDGILTSLDTLVINVADSNRAPTWAAALSDTTTLVVGTEFTFTYEAQDLDTDNTGFTYMMVAGPDSAEVDASTGVFTWTPDSSNMGSYYNVTMRAYDAAGDSTKDTTATLWVFRNLGPTFVEVIPKDTIYVGDTAELTYVASDPNMDVLSYSFYDEYPEGATLVAHGDSVTFTWTPENVSTAVYLIRIAVTDGEFSDSTQTELYVYAVSSEINGAVTYNGTGAEAIEGALVSADGMSDSTDASGMYVISGVDPGTYTVTAEKTDDVGGIKASDALKAALFYLDPVTYPLNAVAQMAADVNNSGSVTTGDAQAILQRSVDPSVTFAKGDWVFESVTKTVGSSAVTANLKGQVVGDVNASYVPGSAIVAGTGKEAAQVNNAVTAMTTDNVKIKAEEEFEVPVTFSGKAGAVTLQFSYPSDKLEFLGIAGPVNYTYRNTDGLITMAWADLSGKAPLQVEDGAIAMLKFKATDKFGKDEVVNLTLEGANSEIADVKGDVIKSAQISVAGIEQSIPKEFALSQNYPNPFNPSTIINYDLPEAGSVKLIVYNLLGEEVARLVDKELEAGSYKAHWKAANFASGMYIYRITVEGVKNFVQTKKMLLVK